MIAFNLEEGMSSWKNRLVIFITILLIVSSPIFLVTGYTALYWAWLRADLERALPYLPWASNFGMLAMVGAIAGLAILFSSNTFPIAPKTRLTLSMLQFHYSLETFDIQRGTGNPKRETPFYAFPNALRTLSGVAGDSTHLPVALWMAMMTRCVLAREWLMPLAP